MTGMARMRGAIRPGRLPKGVVPRLHGRPGAWSGTSVCTAADKSRALRRSHSFNQRRLVVSPKAAYKDGLVTGNPRTSIFVLTLIIDRIGQIGRIVCISEAARGRPGLDWLWVLAVARDIPFKCVVGYDWLRYDTSHNTTRTTKRLPCLIGSMPSFLLLFFPLHSLLSQWNTSQLTSHPSPVVLVSIVLIV